MYKTEGEKAGTDITMKGKQPGGNRKENRYKGEESFSTMGGIFRKSESLVKAKHHTFLFHSSPDLS